MVVRQALQRPRTVSISTTLVPRHARDTSTLTHVEGPRGCATRVFRYPLAATIAIWVMAAAGTTLGQQPQPQTPVAPATASIAGRLTDGTTRQSIVGGLVVLRELASRDQRLVNTSETGEFTIVDLPAATYSLDASALGYVGRQYGQRHPLERGVPIALRAGETRRQVDVALLPGAAIAGRVTTQDGQPLAFAEVEALRPQLEDNLRVLLRVGRGESNERGEFRIVGLAPGHYYVAAIDPADEGTEDATGRIHWAQTFYPGTSTPAAAERLRLASGATVTDVDFPLLSVSRVSVLGRLVNLDASALATGSVIMSPESDEGLGLGVAQAAIVRPDGTFAFKDVSPGNYRLRASARTIRPGPSLFASFQLAVQNVDISGAVLSLNPGARLFGQVEIAGGTSQPQPVMTDLWVSAPMARRLDGFRAHTQPGPRGWQLQPREPGGQPGDPTRGVAGPVVARNGGLSGPQHDRRAVRAAVRG